MQCGPIRHRVNAKEQALARPFKHFVIPRPTNFRLPPSSELPGTGRPDDLGGDNLLVFVKRDGAFVFELHRRPLALGDERPRQPVHVHAEVVQPPEKDIGGHFPRLHGFQ